MEYFQTTLFQETELDEVKTELAKTKKEVGNIRRGFFARHEEIIQTQDTTVEMIKTLKSELQGLREEILSLQELYATNVSTFVGGMTGVGVDAGFATGSRFTVAPISSLMMASHSSSTGLSGPR